MGYLDPLAAHDSCFPDAKTNRSQKEERTSKTSWPPDYRAKLSVRASPCGTDQYAVFVAEV